MATIWQQAEELKDEMVERRRDLHRHPETGWTEFRTASMIIGELKNLGYDVKFGDDVIDEKSMMGVPSEQSWLIICKEQSAKVRIRSW